MNKYKDGVGSKMRYNKQELKTIKVAVHRKDIPETSNSSALLVRDLENPEDLIVHVRHGEGQRPIFDRDDVRVNEEFQKLIILTDADKNQEHGRSCSSHGVEKTPKDNWHRTTSRSPSRRRSRSSTLSSDREYPRQRKYSRERSVSPQKNPYDPYKASKERRDEQRERFAPRSSKDEVKRSERKKTRSCSPHYSQRQEQVKPYQKETYSSSKTDKYKAAPYSRESKREYPAACSSRNKSEYASHSKEHRRSPSAEKRVHYSKRYGSPSRRESSSPHRSGTYRETSYSEYRSRKRTPSPYKQHKSTDVERHRKRSRSPSRTRSYRSRSPRRPEKFRESARQSPHVHRSESRRDYRKDASRSPSRHERYKERSGRRYSRSRSREGRRSPRRRRSPSPNVRDGYLHVPTAGPVGPINYGPPWYPWPQPLGPRFIPPHGPIRMQRPPFVPLQPPIFIQHPRPPKIYNNRSTKFTLAGGSKTADNPAPTSTITSQSTSNSTAAATSTSAVSEDATAVAVDAVVTCESTTNTVNSTVDVDRANKEI